MTFDPWADLARRKGVDLQWHHKGQRLEFPDAWGLTTFSLLQVSLRVGLNEVEIRCTVAHECVHLDRGPVKGKNTDREEDIVGLIAAQRLIDPRAFEAFAAGHEDPTSRDIARGLGVDRATYEDYADWRQGVQGATARRGWKRALDVPAWPPAWAAERAPIAARLDAP